MKFRSLVFFFLFMYGTCLPQEIVSFNITQKEGLPSNTVYDIFQDKNGFLWVATENGLARYNGVHFRMYENRSLRSKSVSGILQDDEGRIWLHNFFGEVIYVENDTLQKLQSWEDLYTEGFPTITNLDSSLLISASENIFRYTFSNNTWENLNFHKNKLGSTYSDHLADHKNAVWVCYSTKEETVVKKMNSDEKYVLPRKNYPLGINVLRLIEWQDELWLFDLSTKNLFQLKNDSILNISNRYRDILKSTRTITNHGDSVLSFIGSEGATLINRNDDVISLIKNKNVSGIATDAEGGIWIGTLSEGLFYFPFLKSTLYSKNQHGLFTKLVYDKKHKRLIAGGFDGDVYFFSRDQKEPVRLLTSSGKEVQSIFVDSVLNHLLVFSDRLYVYGLDDPQQPYILNVAAVKKIEKLKDEYALATSAGLMLIDAVTLEKKNQLLSSQRISTLAYQQDEETIWIGTQKGVFTYSLQAKKITPWFSNEHQYSPGISSLLIYNDLVILGTFTNGLYFVKDNRVAKHFTVENGLLSDHISSLAIHNQILWIGTDKGISSLNLESEKFSIIDNTKGLATNEIYDLVFVDSTLWISHPQGLQQFNSAVKLNQQKPRLYINQITSDLLTMTNIDKGIVLSPSSQQLTFYFDVSNNLKGLGSTKIFYRIKGLYNDRWNSTTLLNPIANYLALPSGNFEFEAYVVNEDGFRSETILTFPITVLTPFWKRIEFIGFVFICSILVVGLILYNYFKRINDRNKIKSQQLTQEQELRIAQLTSIRAQMNPHFIFNTLALIQGKVLNGLKNEASKSIQDFSFLLRKVLYFSSKEMILITDEIEILEKYLSIENDRFDGTLQYVITTDDTVQNEIIRIPSLLTQPFVENALRHGLMHKHGMKELSIEFKVETDLLTITIDDNGIGRKASAEFNRARKNEHQSFAMAAYTKRIDLLNSSSKRKIELAITDKINPFGLSNGTTVQITLPLAHDFS